jgi:hypothetical protein
MDSIGVSVTLSPISQPQGGPSRTASLARATTTIVSQSHARSDWWVRNWISGIAGGCVSVVEGGLIRRRLRRAPQRGVQARLQWVKPFWSQCD